MLPARRSASFGSARDIVLALTRLDKQTSQNSSVRLRLVKSLATSANFKIFNHIESYGTWSIKYK